MRIEALAVCVALAGCSLAPDYKPPEVAAPQAFRETGLWMQGTPQDALPRQAWWRLYDDAVLNGLEDRIAAGNPTLEEALARYDAAEGYLSQAQSGLLPTITAGGHADTDKQSANRPLRSASQPTYYGDDLAGVSLSWDLDLWGRVRNEVAAGEAEAEASLADVQSVRLSLEAQLGGDYLQLRGLDAQAQLLRDTIGIYGKALDLTNERHEKGIVSGLDVSRAQALLADAKAQRDDVLGRRALLEHAIASLVGTPASGFTVAPANADFHVPNIPAGVPSTLLQRRPDIAAAERRMAASNAGIGIARAAFYPDISLAALAGFQNTGNDALFTAPDALWSLGPSAALTLFDNGRLEGQLAVARAANRAAVARYRATVLQAFQEVEDNLALLNRLAEEAGQQAVSVAAADRTQTLSLALYRNGALGFLDVVVAQTTALQARQAALGIQTRRLLASVGLIHAIGGGWDSASGLTALTPVNDTVSGACDSFVKGEGKPVKGSGRCAS